MTLGLGLLALATPFRSFRPIWPASEIRPSGIDPLADIGNRQHCSGKQS